LRALHSTAFITYWQRRQGQGPLYVGAEKRASPGRLLTFQSPKINTRLSRRTRTERASFPAFSSSLSHARLSRTRRKIIIHLHDTHLEQLCILLEDTPAVMLPSYRHLLSFIKLLARFSRNETPVGSQHPFGLGMDPIYPITREPALSPTSFTRGPIGGPHGSLSLWESSGLTTFRMNTQE